MTRELDLNDEWMTVNDYIPKGLRQDIIAHEWPEYAAAGKDPYDPPSGPPRSFLLQFKNGREVWLRNMKPRDILRGMSRSS